MEKKYFRSFEDIDVWKRGCRLAVKIYEISKQGELAKDFGLRDQIRRASISIPSNIAEGFERESKAEFNRYLLIAKGSCGELRTQLFIAKAINAVESKSCDELINECKEVSSMLSGLIRHLKNQKDSSK